MNTKELQRQNRIFHGEDVVTVVPASGIRHTWGIRGHDNFDYVRKGTRILKGVRYARYVALYLLDLGEAQHGHVSLLALSETYPGDTFLPYFKNLCDDIQTGINSLVLPADSAGGPNVSLDDLAREALEKHRRRCFVSPC